MPISGAPDITPDRDAVTIGTATIPRPKHLGAGQWIAFWETVREVAEGGVNPDDLAGRVAELEAEVERLEDELADARSVIATMENA